MWIQEIISLIAKLDVKLVVLLCHHNADPDAVCAAYAFSQLLKRIQPQLIIEIAAAQGVSKLSKFLMNSLPVKLTIQPRIEKAGLIVLLDTNTIQQLDELSERVKTSMSPIIVIDHHAVHPETKLLADMMVTDGEASSTCEIIYNFFKELGLKFEESEARALFLGIAFDTRHFMLANSTTFKIVAELVNAGVNTEEALSSLSLPMDLSERFSRLKAGQRLKLQKVDDWLIVLSNVGSYQASAARALIRLGAHVAIVAGRRKNKLQISIRANSDFHEKTGIHLGRDIAKALGEHLHGMGGGHSTSAGANGIGDVEDSLKHCMELIRMKLDNTSF